MFCFLLLHGWELAVCLQIACYSRMLGSYNSSRFQEQTGFLKTRSTETLMCFQIISSNEKNLIFRFSCFYVQEKEKHFQAILTLKIYIPYPIRLLNIQWSTFIGKERLFACSSYNNKDFCWQKQAECILGSKASYL